MRILVVGAGATGGYFGARLAQAGRDVTFLVRERRKQQLDQQGLQVRSPLGDFAITPKTRLASELETADLIILTVKSFALEQALEDIAPAVGEQTLIMPILNGMRHINLLRQRFGAEKVIGGLCKIHATLGPQGEIVQMSPLHQIYYGELDGENSARLQALDALFSGCGVDNILTENLFSDLWEKWLLLSTLGAVTSLSRGNTQQVLQSPGGEILLQGLFSEILEVMRADGYQERPAVTAKIYETLNNPATPMTSSMYRDLTQGNAVEADHIIGDLLARAARNSVPTPLLNAVYVNLCVYQRAR
ncbi:ketopantoate reductase family protein [Pantoea sp.]|uniref:ketopantoate reductase family protein n=1 Tax=Pantoea sp. TaxID=69393 RepID=UPI00289924EA|nr:ketopantoate reductase family protein [Pantoea sp.]